ncbi:hypothetical protein BDZ91DRAFT_851851 [Kalaharituber pfeilii]|nr:hypothetical protein BDZ91DRAFT_851851 [Kalaharituber pfeilii]
MSYSVSEDLSEEILPYRPQRRCYNISTSTAITTETPGSSSHPELISKFKPGGVTPELAQSSKPEGGRKKNSFLLLMNQIATAIVERRLPEAVLELSLYESDPTDFIGRGKSFYVTRMKLPARFKLRRIAGRTTFAMSTIPEWKEAAMSGAESEMIIRKMPLIEYNIHGMPKDNANEERSKAVLLEFLALMHEPLFNHPNIIDLLGVCWEPDMSEQTLLDQHIQPAFLVPILLLENARLGSLDQFMETTVYETRSMKEKAQLCRDVAEGLFALHSCGIVHGDVKPENILIFDSRQGDRYIAKLGDFGFSVNQSKEDVVMKSKGQASWKLVGRSWPWNDPECHLPRTWDQLQKTDVFSYGLLVWSVLSGNAIENLFDLDHRKDDRQDPLLRQMVEGLKNDGTLGNNATTYFRKFDPLIQLLVRCLFEFSLHPVVSLRGTIEDICNIWNIWFNDTRGWPKSKFWPMNEVDLEHSFLNRALNGMQQCPQTIKQRFITIAEDESYSWKDKLELLTYRGLCHLIGWGVEKDFAMAKAFIDEAANISPAAAIYQAMFLEDTQPEDRSFFKAMDGNLDSKYEHDLFRRLQTLWLESRSYEGLRQLKRYFPVFPTIPEFWHRLRCQQFRQLRYGITEMSCGMAKPLGIELHQALLLDIAENHSAPSVIGIGHNKLHFAVCLGHPEALETLLQSPDLDMALVHERDHFGDTPFLFACRLGAFRAASLLADAGSDVTVCNYYGENALHFLCDFENEQEMAEIASIVVAHGGTALLHAGAAATYPPEAINTTLIVGPGPPLTRAVSRNNLAVAKVLLQYGAKPQHYAELGKNLALAKILKPGMKLQLYDDLGWGMSAMRHAASIHSVDMLKLFASYIPDDEVCEWISYLKSAIGDRMALGFHRMYLHGPKYIDKMKSTFDFLLDHISERPIYFQVNDLRFPLIAYTVVMGDQDMLEYLLGKLGSSGIDLYYGGVGTALHEAIMMGSIGKFKLLLKSGAYPDAPVFHTGDDESSTASTLAFCCSSLGGTAEMVKELLRVGAHRQRVQGKNAKGLPPFTAAVLAYKLDIAQVLLEADDDGTIMSVTSDSGFTVVGHVVRVCSIRSVSMLRFLFSRDPPTKRPTHIAHPRLQATVFHLIASVGWWLAKYDRRVVGDILDFLLDRFPDPAIVNAITTDRGNTALHVAAMSTNLTVVQRLVQYKDIDLYARNEEGLTAYHYALGGILSDVRPQLTAMGQSVVERYRQDQYEIRNRLARAMGMGGPDWIDGMEIDKLTMRMRTSDGRGHVLKVVHDGEGL